MCFTRPHAAWSKAVSGQKKPVWEYYFSKENGEIGSNHSGELIYAYRNVPRNKKYNSSDYELEEIMSSYWINFVKTGNPNGKDTKGRPLPLWQEFSESGGKVLELGENCLMTEDPFAYIYEYCSD